MVKKLYVLILLIFLLSSCEDGKVKGDIKIYVASDNHLLDDSINDKGENFSNMMKRGNGSFIGYSREINGAFFNQVIKDGPDYLILSGDLTYNGEKKSHLLMAKFLKEVERKSKTEVLLIPGNHDISNPWARGFKGKDQFPVENISKDEFPKIYGDFGYNQAIYRDGDSLSYVYELSDDLWILMVDTSQYKFNGIMPTTSGSVGDKTLKWIKEISDIAKGKNKNLISSSHHNLYKHSPSIYEGYVLDNNGEVLDLLEESGAKVNFSGHVHIQSIKGDDNWNIIDIATGSLSQYRSQFAQVDINRENNTFNYIVKDVDVNNWARENKLSDENLLSFDKYQREYYEYFSMMQGKSHLHWNNSYLQEDDIDKMAYVFGYLNSDYFSGKKTEKFNEIIGSEGFDLWMENPNDLTTYVRSIGDLEDNTSIEIKNFFNNIRVDK